MDRNHVVYFACPFSRPTGGIELLHQAAAAIRELGGNSEIVIYNLKPGSEAPEVPGQYRQYIQRYILPEQVIDSPANILVVPEVCPTFGLKFKEIKVYLWWLSVDNFRAGFDLRFIRGRQGLLRAARRALRFPVRRARRAIARADKHLYQSEYAKNFVHYELGIGLDDVARLSDYLSDSYRSQAVSPNHSQYRGALPPDRDETEKVRTPAGATSLPSSSNRVARVLYNPRKGVDVTQRLMALHPEFDWVALDGFSADQLAELFRTSTVYLDLGEHPGKDRLPRESAAMGCCVITNRQGAAAYSEDYPIPEECRYEVNMDSSDEVFHAIARRINECSNEFQHWYPRYEQYRSQIALEKDRFYAEVKEIFF